jgi:hypothetical protein
VFWKKRYGKNGVLVPGKGQSAVKNPNALITPHVVKNTDALKDLHVVKGLHAMKDLHVVKGLHAMKNTDALKGLHAMKNTDAAKDLHAVKNTDTVKKSPSGPPPKGPKSSVTRKIGKKAGGWWLENISGSQQRKLIR